MGIHIQFPASNVDELSSEIRSFLPKSSNSVIKDELWFLFKLKTAINLYIKSFWTFYTKIAKFFFVIKK